MNPFTTSLGNSAEAPPWATCVFKSLSDRFLNFTVQHNYKAVFVCFATSLWKAQLALVPPYQRPQMRTFRPGPSPTDWWQMRAHCCFMQLCFKMICYKVIHDFTSPWNLGQFLVFWKTRYPGLALPQPGSVCCSAARVLSGER